MERRFSIAGTPEVNVPIRVRGLSHEERYFDEQNVTTHLTRDFIVIRLRNLVDLDTELHITNMRTQIGGTYRVAWINTRAEEDLHPVGLELLDPEGEIWEPDSVTDGSELGDGAPVAQLECVRCAGSVSTELPEADTASVGAGFTIARHCDTCKATTGWAYHVEVPPAAEAPGESETATVAAGPVPVAPATADVFAAASGEPATEHRTKGRAPIRLTIKIIRTKYGLNVFDICQTINVSRTGVYFATEQGYEVGETVEIILPYHPDSVAIPVQARVVRRDETPGTYQKRVALTLISWATTGR